MVLSMLRSFGKIGPQIDQILAWLSRGHRWSPGVRNPLKSSVMGPSFFGQLLSRNQVSQNNQGEPPPPPPPPPPLKEVHIIKNYIETYSRDLLAARLSQVWDRS